MNISKTSYQDMPFFLRLLTGQALAGFLLVFFAVWEIISGHPVLPNIILALVGLYFGICGILFLARWKYAREIYLSIFFFNAVFLLVSGANLFLFLWLSIIVLAIALYLYKKDSVTNYFSLKE